MIEGTFRGKPIRVPECIDELSEKQYKYLLSLAFLLADKVIDMEGARKMWQQELLGIAIDLGLLKPELQREAAALDTTEGFFSVWEDGNQSIKFDMTRNLLQEFGGYKGPGDWLNGTTFGEFCECVTAMEAAAEGGTEEMEEVCRHIARVLYHIPEGERVPDTLAFHAPTFLSSVWRKFQEAPIEINGKKIDFRIIFKGTGETRADDKTGWTGILFEVAAAGVFGPIREVEKADMWEVLIYLYRAKFEYLEEKKRERRTKN